jgi:glyoxalase family protein
MKLHGLHHVTAVTAHAKANLNFYTNVLGLRLVKKTVNQDDVSAYHLFYADAVGSPGTDMTFFDWPSSGKRVGDTDGILRTLLSVQSTETLSFWKQRLEGSGAINIAPEKLGTRDALFFEDPEGQRLGLVVSIESFHGKVWEREDIPTGMELRGFYAVCLVVPELLLPETILTNVLGFTKGDTYTLSTGEVFHTYTLAEGGAGKEVHITVKPGAPLRAFAGGVHHVAFRVNDVEELERWQDFLNNVRIGNSGLVERYYFTSLYFRISNGILFELATDGPGFAADEDMASLGEKLSLAPFLEGRRGEIERGLKVLD